MQNLAKIVFKLAYISKNGSYGPCGALRQETDSCKLYRGEKEAETILHLQITCREFCLKEKEAARRLLLW